MCKIQGLRSKVNGAIKVHNENNVMDKEVKDLNSHKKVVVGRATKGKVGIHDGREGETVTGKLKKSGDIEFNGSPHNFNILESKLIQCFVLETRKEQF